MSRLQFMQRLSSPHLVKGTWGGLRFYGKMQNSLGGSSLWSEYSSKFCKVSCSPFGKNEFSSGCIKSALDIEMIPCLKDNYAYLLHDTQSGVTGVIDPSEAGPVVDLLKKKHLNLMYIINTHHHWDHTGGNVELKSRYSAKVVGHVADKDRIPGIDVLLHSGQVWMFGDEEMHVLDTPGHTCGHICLYFPNTKSIFTGDTLFSLTCGKLFEGTPEQMFNSLLKIASFPDDTQIYCGHEYTLSSAKFAVAMEPSNKDLAAYFEKVKELRKKALPTIPSTIRQEKSCNPFLRLSSLEIRRSLGTVDNASEVQTLAALRRAKDNW